MAQYGVLAGTLTLLNERLLCKLTLTISIRWLIVRQPKNYVKLFIHVVSAIKRWTVLIYAITRRDI